MWPGGGDKLSNAENPLMSLLAVLRLFLEPVAAAALL